MCLYPKTCRLKQGSHVFFSVSTEVAKIFRGLDVKSSNVRHTHVPQGMAFSFSMGTRCWST